MLRLALALMLLAGCTNSLPCSSCPNVSGVWFLQYMAVDFPCDGGALNAPPMTVQLQQEGSVLRGAIDGVSLTGTLYDTFELSLSGSGTRTVSLRAVFRPGNGDGGGEQLIGGSLSRSDGSCQESRRFTGARY